MFESAVLQIVVVLLNLLVQILLVFSEVFQGLGEPLDFLALLFADLRAIRNLRVSRMSR